MTGHHASSSVDEGFPGPAVLRGRSANVPETRLRFPRELPLRARLAHGEHSGIGTSGISGKPSSALRGPIGLCEQRRLGDPVIHQGFRILFKMVSPTMTRPVFQTNYAHEPRRQSLLDVIADYVRKGAVFRLSGNPGPGLPGFLVPKRSGAWRMVIDLHLLNQFTLADMFKMESVNSIRLALRRGEWAASVDLSDAYLHIHIGTVLLHASDRNGVLSLLSRGTSVPRVPGRFTVSGQHPVAVPSTGGVSNVPNTLPRILDKRQEIRTDSLPRIHFLGVTFNLVRGTVCPAPHRLQTFRQLCNVLTKLTAATPRDLHRLLGHMESFSHLLPGAMRLNASYSCSCCRNGTTTTETYRLP